MKTENNQVVYATDSNWNELLTKPGVLVVDFGADWCGPCRLMEPIMNELATDFAGSATVATLDIENNPAVSAQYKVRNIPTILVFRNGELVSRHVGVTAKKLLAQTIDGVMAVEAH